MSNRTRGLIVLTSLALAVSACGGDPEDDPDVGTIAQSEATASPGQSGGATEQDGEEPQEEAAPAAPLVAETGFATSEFGSGVIVAVIKNPSPTHGGSVTVSGTAYDTAGQVLGTSSSDLILRSAETSAVAGDVSVPEGKKIAKVTVQAAFDQTEVDEHQQARLTGRNVQVADDGYGTITANGEVVSAYESDLKDVQTTAVCRNAAGAINGGGYTYLDLLPGGGTTGASVNVTTQEKPAKCDLHSTLSILSTLDS